MKENIFSFFFEDLGYCTVRGRGLTIFGSDKELVKKFVSECKPRKLKYLYLEASDLINKIVKHRRFANEKNKKSNSVKNFLLNPGYHLFAYKDELQDIKFKLNENSLLIFYQDLSLHLFLEEIQTIVEQIIYPFWFEKKIICFFSAISKSEYTVKSIPSDLIHSDYKSVTDFLFCEQLLNLLARSTYQISKEDLVKNRKLLFTENELILKKELEKSGVLCQSKLKHEKNYFDFEINLEGKKVLICIDDKNPFHNTVTSNDNMNYKKKYTVVHLRNSEIINDIHGCMNKIFSGNDESKIKTVEIDTDLDQTQIEAGKCVYGPIRVLAPAGSGKTKTLINRIISLINHGIAEENILALAFNKKACDEMINRLESRNIRNVEVRTFHSFGYEILRRKWGWKYDATNEKVIQRNLMNEAVKQNFQITPKRNIDILDIFINALRKVKTELIPLIDAFVEVEGQKFPFEPVFKTYLDLQMKSKFFNFDDMIYFANRILLEDEELRKYYQNKFQFILVDEFQDLNMAQLLLLQILSLPENNVFVVGDDDQMIYGWRGAQVRHIIDFTRRYPVAKNYILSINYRSSKKVVYHSRWLIEHNQERVFKDIKPRHSASKGIFDFELRDALWEQAIAAADWLIDFKEKNNFKWKDFAVLFRLNAYQFPIALVFDMKKIPHSPVVIENLFKSPVGNDIYSYLTLILFPEKSTPEEIARALKRPNKFLSNKLIETIISWDALNDFSDKSAFKEFEIEQLKKFLSQIKKFQEWVKQKDISPQELLVQLNREFNLAEFYRSYSLACLELDEASDDTTFEVILSVAKYFKSLSSFYEYIQHSINYKVSEVETQPVLTEDQVTLTTIHKTKGNEYTNVIYFNLSEGYTNCSPKEEEEERRVTYVGITRAKKNIFITALKNSPSKFLIEAALNPEFKKLSLVLLEDWFNSKKRKFNGLIKKKPSLQMKKAYLEKKLEKYSLSQNENGTTNSSRSFFKTFETKLKLLRKEKFAQKLERIKSELFQLEERVLPELQNKIEELETEILLRKKLSINKIVRHKN